VELSAGEHQLTLIGFENCCDAGNQVEYSINGGGFTYFPEPSAWVTMLLGFGMVGAVSRRGRTAAVRSLEG
jgi:hypothetical protein